VYPNEPLPQPYEVLSKYEGPPAELIEASRRHLDVVISTARVQKVPPKQKGKRKRENDRPLSNLDIDALLSSTKRQKIDPSNAIPEFVQAVSTAGDVGRIREARRQLSKIIDDLVDGGDETSVGKVIEMLRIMRREMIEIEEPEEYNSYVKQLKTKLESRRGPTREVWYKMKVNRLGLIDKSCEGSKVTPQEAQEVRRILS